MSEKVFDFDLGANPIEIVECPRPATREGEREALLLDFRRALERIAAALRLPGSPSLVSTVPEAVEKLVALRSKRFLVLRGIPFYPAAFEDWVGAYPTFEEARKAACDIHPKEAMWYSIFDLEEDHVVEDAEIDPTWTVTKAVP